MDWNDVRHFLALARTGSARAAGAALGVSHSTVVRRIDALENQLSTRLFDRNRDGYTLTDAGVRMVPGAERVEREMAALERGLAGTDERLEGPVVVTCSDHGMSALLLDQLYDFCARYPEIELHLNTDSRSYDLSKREADIALRVLSVGQSPPEHLIGNKLLPLTMGSYVARAHADRLDPSLPGTRWVGFDEPRVMRMMVDGSSYPTLPTWGALSSIELMVQALYRGYGIGFLPTYVGDVDPGLQRLPEPDLRHLADIWMLTHPDLRDNARYRATRRWIASVLKAQLDLFDGTRCGAAPERSEIAPETSASRLVP